MADVFIQSGPSWIPSDSHWWNNTNHKRSVVACLVNGTYILEKDRKAKRETGLASPWWVSFGFKLHKRITDNHGSHIGAIYQHKHHASRLRNTNSPSYVIAFRGTIVKGINLFLDMKDNLNLIINRLHRRSRSQIALEAIKELLDDPSVNRRRVWLAGHSLGSSVAMLAGKHLVRKMGFDHLECFLFNPPFISLPIASSLKKESIKRFIGLVSTNFVYIAALAIKKDYLNMDKFLELSRWHPRLFVHPEDHICSEYITYLEYREWKEKIGAGAVNKVAAGYSILGLLLNNKDEDKEEEEPLHLIPSAKLTVNKTPPNQQFKPHDLNQWWNQGLQLESSDCDLAHCVKCGRGRL